MAGSGKDIYGHDDQGLANRVTGRVIDAALKRDGGRGIHEVEPYAEGNDHSYSRGRGKEDGHTEHSGEGKVRG